jgi:dihydroorotase
LYFTKTYLLTIQKQWKNYLLTAIHYCHSFRKEEIVETNEQAFREQYGEDVPVISSIIRSTKGCYEATKRAIDLAKKHNADYILNYRSRNSSVSE